MLNNLISIKKRSGFCGKLLDLMSRCLEKDSHVRIDMDELVRTLAEIEYEFYFRSSNYKRIYLRAEPMNLYSFSSNQVENQSSEEFLLCESEGVNNREQMDNTIAEAIRCATLDRSTALY